MAADRKYSHNETMFYGKKLERHGDIIISTAGTADIGTDFIEWLKGGDEPETLDDMDAIVLTPQGIFVYAETIIPVQLEQDFYAIGSGAHAALGAMFCGKNPVEAVEIAAKIDPYTGGVVDVEYL